MTNQRQPAASTHEAILGGAVEAEALHYRTMMQIQDGDSGLDALLGSLAASLAAAALGAALRFVRDHASLADRELKRQARVAAKLVDELPDELHMLWLLHYVEGYPLSVYATATGVTMAAANEDYRNLTWELVNATRKIAAAPSLERAEG
jgi:hypothetical protein